MPDIIIIRGPLGIGKTTIAKRLANKLSAEYFSVDKILAENDLDKLKDGIPVDNFLKVNKFIISKINNIYAEGGSSIIDGNFYYKEVIDDLNERLVVSPKIFTLTAPLSVCLNRDASRKNSLGQLAVRAVYNLVSRLKYGQEIKANEKDIDGIISDIKKYLKS